MDQLVNISDFIFDSFIHIWPYLLITIPIAVAMKVSGAAGYINMAFSSKPVFSVLLATVAGAFSPFCSCGVVPVIAALLLGGVPLAPVMSFWIASPSMDPEIFFLSTASIGWELSVWRLGATFIISLLSGYFTLIAFQKGLLGREILRGKLTNSQKNQGVSPARIVAKIKGISVPAFNKQPAVAGNAPVPPVLNCCTPARESQCSPEGTEGATCNSVAPTPTRKVTLANLLRETAAASLMVIKFMFLAFFINALIHFYAPPEYISSFLGGSGASSVVTASLIGIPAYTSNLTALPLINGLLDLGMNPGAALSFLIAGPATTLPAMTAVYGLVKRKIFLLYVSYSLIGAVISGLLYNLLH